MRRGDHGGGGSRRARDDGHLEDGCVDSGDAGGDCDVDSNGLQFDWGRMGGAGHVCEGKLQCIQPKTDVAANGGGNRHHRRGAGDIDDGELEGVFPGGNVFVYGSGLGGSHSGGCTGGVGDGEARNSRPWTHVLGLGVGVRDNPGAHLGIGVDGSRIDVEEGRLVDGEGLSSMNDDCRREGSGANNQGIVEGGLNVLRDVGLRGFLEVQLKGHVKKEEGG